jgi:5-methylphenazine-1-carboxylate 1-monooxygenase
MVPCSSNTVRLTDRAHPPDFINVKVEELVGASRFEDLDRYITQDELRALSEDYEQAAEFALGDVGVEVNQPGVL